LGGGGNQGDVTPIDSIVMVKGLTSSFRRFTVDHADFWAVDRIEFQPLTVAYAYIYRRMRSDSTLP